MTLFESLASRRPVIVSDIPAFKSIVNDNNVLFFSSENAIDLKEKILKLITYPFIAHMIGKNGRELAEDYDWNVIAEKTKKVYND